MRKNREGKMRETRLRRRAAACGMSILLSLTGLISVPGVETEREITRLKPSDATTQTIRETEFTGSEADTSFITTQLAISQVRTSGIYLVI